MSSKDDAADGLIDRDRIEHSIRSLLATRSAASSICPSEVARDVAGPDATRWRPQMPLVRAVAADLARRGVLSITRRGETLNSAALEGGPIRLRRGPEFPEA